MTMIPCPECDKEVSDRARACPHCGFPVAEEIGRVLAEVTGFDSVRSVRQQLAANKLRTWGERYTESEGKSRQLDSLAGEGVGPRQRKIVIVAIAVLFVIVQIAVLFSVVYR